MVEDRRGILAAARQARARKAFFAILAAVFVSALFAALAGAQEKPQPAQAPPPGSAVLQNGPANREIGAPGQSTPAPPEFLKMIEQIGETQVELAEQQIITAYVQKKLTEQRAEINKYAAEKFPGQRYDAATRSFVELPKAPPSAAPSAK